MKTTTKTTEITITIAPLAFEVPSNKIARATAERTAVAEVSRAVNAAYYAGIIG